MKTNLKPFDLEAAKAGAPVVTRNGRSVRIICTDMIDGEYPVIALVREGHWESLRSYTTDGKCVVGEIISELDLFMASVKRLGWVNLYRDGGNRIVTGNTVHDSKSEASGGSDDFTDYLATVPVEWEE